MSPKSKRSGNIATSKENIFVPIKSKLIRSSRSTRAPRKALSDKTNSASDDDAPTSPKLGVRTRKATNKIKNNGKFEKVNDELTKDNAENRSIFMNSNSHNKPVVGKGGYIKRQKKLVVLISPLKVIETKITDSRPKRICRLPSKFEDHSMSPNKFIPVQPIKASTPIAANTKAKISTKVVTIKDKVQVKTNLKTNQAKNRTLINPNENTLHKSDSSTERLKKRNARSHKQFPIRKVTQNNPKNISTKKKADSNNNANESNDQTNLCSISSSCNKKSTIVNKSSRTSDIKRKTLKRDASVLDVYEFTYDPSEEPPPQKKKPRRTVRKKKEKPKPVFKHNYDKTVTKSMVALKKILSVQSQNKTIKPIQQLPQNEEERNRNFVKNVAQKEDTIKKNISTQNFNSFQVEDILVDHVDNDHDNINYSPINSPHHDEQPSVQIGINGATEVTTFDKDPLKLQEKEDFSFFDEHPVASSSLNMSARNPSATPWRVEFGQLPIKWQVNTYVKPNMTPAFESSFINFNDKKKHVYTNIVPEHDAILPEIVQSETASKLKQTSILSFIKEVVERSAKKKNKLKSTPIKENSIFEDISISSNAFTPTKQVVTSSVNKSVTPNRGILTENDINKSNSQVNDKDYDEIEQNDSPKVKQKAFQNKNCDKNITFFGFDESEEQNQENVSPKKKLDKQRKKALRSHSRAVLKEFNAQIGPTRAHVLVSNKKNDNFYNDEVVSEGKTVDKDLEALKAIVDSEMPQGADNVNIDNSTRLNQEDSLSVHLFEDLEIVHHNKPSRKSYGKPKRVAFRQNSESSDTQENDIANNHDGSSMEEDNLDDLTFQMPSQKPKKSRKKKKQFSKKEEKEAEAWAAGFNSMCEDVDHFDLVIE